MKINPKYFRIRTMMLLLPFLGVLIIYFLISLFSDLMTEKAELTKIQGIIKSTRQYEYYDPEIIKGKKTYDVLELYLTNDLIIRLSDELQEKHWQEINSTNNIGKTIVILFHQTLLDNNIVYNPQELTIQEHKILTFENYKTVTMWFFISISILLLLIIYLEYVLVINYKRIYYRKDISANSPLAWEIIKKAFSE